MTRPDPLDAVRTTAAALLARIDAGAPPATGSGRAAQIMQVLRAIVERIMRRQIAHTADVQRHTVLLIEQLAAGLSEELGELRRRQSEQSDADRRLADRSELTESLIDGLTAALTTAASRSPGNQPPPPSS